MTGTAHHTPWPARAGRGTAGAGERWLLVAAVTLGVLLCGGPLALVALEAIAPEGQPTLDPIADALDSRTTWRALLNSLDSALFSGLIATAIGTAMALAVGLTDVRLKGPFTFLLLIPMMVPPHVTAIAWVQALGPSSALLQSLGIAPEIGSTHPLYSREGVIALLAIQHMPLAFLVVRAGLGALPREMVDAARVSGARPARILRRIVLPLLAPTLIAALALTVVSALGNFGIQALLGIPARYTTLPVLMWRRLASFGPQVLSDLAVIAAIIALVAVAVVAVQLALQRRARTALIGPPAAPLAFRLGRARPAVEVALWAWLALVLALPLMSLTATALIPTYGVALTAETVTFENFREVLVRQAVTLRAFANSTLAAGAAAAALAGFAVVLGYYLARPTGPARRVAGGVAALADIAYAVPGLVISIAFILAFIRPLPVLGVSL
ncbi:MAG: ABC transporter permease subunit, partial [Pseudomonadota bacterium]